MKRPAKQEKRHVLLTGGTSGIGNELVRHLHPNCRISIIARPSPKLDELKQHFPDVAVYEADLSDPTAVEHVADAIEKSGETIDLLINNAAIQHTTHFMDEAFEVDTIRREIDTNLTSPAILIFKLLPTLIRSNSGTILNVNSGLGLVPKTSSAVYCATKGGLNILTQSLDNQLRAKGISVKQVFLPLVDTEMTRGRGSGKISPAGAAKAILDGLKNGRQTIDIGKVKALRWIMWLSPALARNIMRRA